MPKVRTFKHFYKRQDVIIDVYYTSELGFYAKVPTQMINAALELAVANRDNEYGVSIFRKKGYNGETYPVIKGDNEKMVIDRFILLYNYLVDAAVVKEPIIVITPQRSKQSAFVGYDDLELIDQYPVVSAQLNFKYCYRVTIANSTPFYEMQVTEKHGRINIYKDDVIIPDTPEARKMLEDMYKALIGLRDKIEDITSSQETLYQAIENRSEFKLLNN